MCEGFALFGAERHSFSKSGSKLILSVSGKLNIKEKKKYPKIGKSKSNETNGISKLT